MQEKYAQEEEEQKLYAYRKKNMPITKYKLTEDIAIYFHRTRELYQIIQETGEKCDLIITMNVATSLLQQVATKETVLYFLSCYHEPSKYVKQAIRTQSHIKLYRTKSYIFISTANLSMSNFQELTIRLPRTAEFDSIIDNILFSLSSIPPFLLNT